MHFHKLFRVFAPCTTGEKIPIYTKIPIHTSHQAPIKDTHSPLHTKHHWMWALSHPSANGLQPT